MEEEEDEDEEEGGEEGGWLISYADLMTLLFAAFVVLYGTTPSGESTQIRGIMASIREAFIEIPDQVPEAFRTAEMFEGKKIFTEVQRDTGINQAVKKFSRVKTPIRGRDLEKDRLDIFLDKISSGQGIHQSLRKATEFSNEEFGFRLRLFDVAYFKKGSIKLTSKAQEYLLKVGKLLKEMEFTVSVEGHTESRPTSKIYNNLELAAVRAGQVKRLFVNQSGISAEKVQTSSYGSLQPIADNGLVSGRKKNNRVEIKIRYNRSAIK